MNLMLALAALLPWSDIDFDQHLKLEQDLVLETAPGAPAVTLKQGTDFEVLDVAGLQVNVVYYQVQMSQCPAELKNLTSEMTIINDNYGVELHPNCEVSLFVENKDLYTSSPFSLVE